ncbi:hypothetical protein ACFLRW_06480 [Acidobacteriota bacterium]
MKLIFVYNAYSGFFNVLGDFAHKFVRPSTYPCNLCALTYGNLSMKMEWKEFISNLDIDVEFIHKNDFRIKYKTNGEFPSAYLREDNLRVFISKTEMETLINLHELMDLVRKKLEKY